MTTPDWISKIEKLLDDAIPGTPHNVLTNLRFFRDAPDNQRKLISALRVALKALEDIYSMENGCVVGGKEGMMWLHQKAAMEAFLQIQKIGGGLK